MISYISEEFVSSAIARLSTQLRLSEAVAGATLLALANGATDILTVILTTSSGEEGSNDFAIGSLFGSSLFAGTFIMGAVILSSNKGSINEVGFDYVARVFAPAPRLAIRDRRVGNLHCRRLARHARRCNGSDFSLPLRTVPRIDHPPRLDEKKSSNDEG